jgi:hypothetical protein
VAGTTRGGFDIFARTVNLSSGTVVKPMLGSIVQKGKLAACALEELMQLKRVDFPTFGSPTIPHLNPMNKN